jgi:hypothetical protein
MQKFKKIVVGYLCFATLVCLLVLEDIRPAVGMILLIHIVQTYDIPSQEDEDES